MVIGSYVSLAAQDWKEVANRVILQNLVYVDTEHTACSGVVISRTQVLSAGHCVRDDKSGVVKDQFGGYHQFDAIAYDPLLDLSLLETEVPVKKAIKFAKENPARGEPTLALGFAGITGQNGMFASTTASHVMGYLPQHHLLVINQVHQMGYSGGPLINLKGELVAINVGTDKDYTKAYSVPISIVNDFLQAVKEGVYRAQ